MMTFTSPRSQKSQLELNLNHILQVFVWLEKLFQSQLKCRPFTNPNFSPQKSQKKKTEKRNKKKKELAKPTTATKMWRETKIDNNVTNFHSLNFFAKSVNDI